MLLKVDDCLVKTNGSDKNIRNILIMQWIMFGVFQSNSCYKYDGKNVR